MWLFVIVLFLLTATYAVLILVYRYWFGKVQRFTDTQTKLPATRFTVIVPARNEAKVIGNCLASLQRQQYPVDLFEVIVVNDHSTDNTEMVVEAWKKQLPSLRLIQLADHLQQQTINAYKKKAIEIAIDQAVGNWIVTTDADCVAPDTWLQQLDSFIQQNNSVLVAAPVIFTDEPSLLGRFQLLDFLSLQGVTAAAVAAGYHSMCNGANLSYRKDAFYAVGKFQGIDNLASGDDMLLMYKLQQQYPNKMGFLFSEAAIMQTAPMYTWKDFFQQRIRWASKATKYADKSIFKVLLLVYLLNLLLAIGLILGCFNTSILSGVLLSLLLKTIVELLFLIPVARFFNAQHALVWFPFFQPLHILYTIIAGWLGKFGSYEWKQRNVH